MKHTLGLGLIITVAAIATVPIAAEEKAMEEQVSSVQPDAAQADGLDKAKVGFYQRLAVVCAVCAVFNGLSLSDYSRFTKTFSNDVAKSITQNLFHHTLILDAALLGAWGCYECYPLSKRAFNYLMETHQDDVQ